MWRMWRIAALFLALAGSAPVLADGLDLRERNFLSEAAILNLTEMHAGKLAEDLAEDQRVRDLARRIADRHATAHERLRAIAAKNGLALPPDIDAPTRQQVAEMQTFTGPAFDRYFLSFQEETHLRALKLFDAQVAYEGDEGLHHYAETGLEMLNEHLRAVEATTAIISGAGAGAREQDRQSAEQPPIPPKEVR